MATADKFGTVMKGLRKRESVYVPQFPKNLEVLKIIIKNAVNAVTPDMISNFSSMAPASIHLCPIHSHYGAKLIN
ncbi:Uncharacterized protein FWK35_00030947 [Aphis craccivora]|uniref:Uncharacterized protein n=1 Tax=Aphis craccivora TaxID=307492 RepID=A0A6G0YP11_APHCR|nr:Uncharacterized protein FWK35_00030947 [Aphis craccivora]